ncbi:MAG: isoprenylcysteine carboxylmethyltransferase family protein [Alphaproteobacteria bacterium]|nr:isoprenylcysteine carboxylmethyltransferase family protein [Alphaproteobacteria bacterium]
MIGTTRFVLAGVLLALGCGGMTAAISRLRRHRTPVETWRPSAALVTDGVYHLSRNPIYVSLSLIYAGIGVALDSLWALAVLAPLLVVIRYGVIAPEERYLAARFGDAYRAYRRSVRRWL